MKRTLLYKLMVFAFFTLAVIHANAQCLSGWNYYAPVKVSNGNTTDLYTYQVRLVVNTQDLITAGKMQTTGADIRFTDSATCTVLPYWIESGMNSSSTVIWVKTTKIPVGGSQTINMYYGNTSAVAMTNGDSTFDLFDDFIGSSLNTAKWTKAGPLSSTWTVSGGTLNLKTKVAADAVITSKASFTSAITEEANVTAVSGNSPSIAIKNGGSFTGYTLNYTSNAMSLNEALASCNSYKTSSAVASSTSPGTLTGIWGIQWPLTNVQKAFWPGGTLSGIDSSRTISTSVNIAAGDLCSANSGTSMTIDWIRVRKYAAVEPTTVVGKERINNIITPIVSNIYCTGAGLKVPFTIVGTFTSGNTFTAQLSDSSGSFAKPSTIGSKNGTTADTISCTLPSNIYGDHYAIRIVANYPDVTGYASAPIRILALPAANAGKNQSICIGDSATLGGAGTGGNTYSWTSSPAGFTSTACKLRVSPSVTTTYTLTETNANGCVASNSVTITVNALPSAKAGKSRSICAGDSVILGDSAVSGSTYSWTSSPAGFASTLANPVVKPSVTTTYTLTETNARGCVASNSVTITVNALPSAKTGANKSICAGDSVALGDSAVNGSTYSWTSSPAGFTSTLAKPVVRPSATTTYTLVETNANGCSAKNTVTVTVNSYPSATTGKDQTICAGSSAIIGAAAVSGNTYNWTSSPAGFTSTDANPVVSPATTTTYTLVETNASGCSAKNSVTISVSALPAANAGSSKTVCPGSSATIGAAAINGSTYSWTSTPSGFTSTSANPTVSPSVTTTYTLTETNANGCTNSNYVTVTVSPLPKAYTGGDKTICQGSTVTLGGDSISGNTYKWTTTTTSYSWGCFGSKTTTTTVGTTASITVSPSATTTYTLTETNASGCTSTNTVTVTVLKSTSVTLCSYPNTCIDAAAFTLKGGSPAGGTYSGDGVSNGIFNPAVAGLGTHTITYSYTNAGGCTSTATSTIKVNASPNPTITITGDTIFCQGGSVTLTSSLADSYSWSANSSSTSSSSCGSGWSSFWSSGSTCGGSSSSNGRSITVTQSGTYYVTVTTGGCSKTSRGVTVIVNPTPTVSAGADITYYYGYDACPTLTASTTTSGASYVWSTGATTQSITVCPTSTTTYWVTVTNSSSCVSSKDYVTVTVVDVHCHDDEDYKGKVKDTTKKILVCHNGVQHCVSKSAVAACLKNGDHLGSCDGDGDDRDNGRSGNDGCGKTDAAAVTTGLSEGLNVAQMFNVYPNPFSTTASIDLSFAKSQNVAIDVISIDGRVMKSLYSGNVIASTSYKLTLDASNMSSGIYMIRVMSGDHIDYRRINLIR